MEDSITMNNMKQFHKQSDANQRRDEEMSTSQTQPCSPKSSSIYPKIHQLHPQRTSFPLHPNRNLDRFCLRHPETIVYHHPILDMKSHMCNGRESSRRRSHLSDQCFPAKPEGYEKGKRVVVASSSALLISSVDSITSSCSGHEGAGGDVVAGVPRCRRW
ncbi:unnamed protein product [Lactuca saligna]|uniref:Uncharacterized protein n=1 Tax=Lactuca saligna TaxID=75948 RepID=A0AA35YVP0_LACSI|nr:unnamed protein product [Lactuca saligna]